MYNVGRSNRNRTYIHCLEDNCTIHCTIDRNEEKSNGAFNWVRTSDLTIMSRVL